MNIIDIIVIGIIGLCVLMGLYRGFVQTVLHLGGSLASVAGSFWLFPKLSDVLSSNTALTRLIATYTDSGSLIGDLGTSSLNVDVLSPENIAAIVEKADLPQPLGTLLSHNLSAKVFEPLGQLATNVGDYANQTILSVSINVLCFMVCFVLCFVAFTIVINLIRAVFRFPVLKHLDGLMGAAFGFLLGVLLCFVLFTLLPLVESALPVPEIRAMVDESKLGQIFRSGNFIVSIMNRKL